MERISTRRGHGLRLLTEDVRRVLRVELIRYGCTADAVAHLFSMSRRTLHRRLHAEGRTYRQIADEIRFEIARMLLAETDLSLNQVAEILRYSALSPFTRAFQHWSGQSPLVRSRTTKLCHTERCAKLAALNRYFDGR